MKQVAITTVSWYHLYEGSDIKIATFSNLHKRACAFGERLMLGLESLFGKIKIAIFPQKKDGSGGGDSTFPTTALQSLSLEGESSTELVAVATEPLTSTSKLLMGWALRKRGASERLSKNFRQFLTQKFNIG